MQSGSKKVLIILIIAIVYISCKKDSPVEPTAAITEFVPAPVTDVVLWTINPSDFEHLMTVVAAIKMGKEMECSAGNKLAAFVGNEVRGVATSYTHLGCVNYNLIVYSNAPDDSVSFGIYLASKDTAVAAAEQFIFQTNSGIGTPDVPYILNIIH